MPRPEPSEVLALEQLHTWMADRGTRTRTALIAHATNPERGSSADVQVRLHERDGYAERAYWAEDPILANAILRALAGISRGRTDGPKQEPRS